VKLAVGLALIITSASAAAPAAGWAHVGNSYNSAIFVDRAILSATDAQRPFRTLHINAQPAAGWLRAEHRGIIDCTAQTLFYERVTITRADGSREFLPSALTKPVPFPQRGLMRTVATAMCSGGLGPAVPDPAAWTRDNFRPG